MLMTGFPLKVFDAIKAKNIKNTFPALDLGVVRDKTVGCTMVADQIFKGLGHARFKNVHRVHNSLGTGLAELSHSSPSMTKDAIIISRSVTEEGVSCNTFIPAMDIVGMEAGFVVFLHRYSHRGLSKLGGGFNGIFNAINSLRSSRSS
jgi:hypothetical protein